MDIYVGNIHPATTQAEMQSLFELFGVVTKSYVSPVGFARMEMPNAEEGQNAINHLFGKELHGHKLLVAECPGHQGDYVEYEDDEDDLDDDED